MFSMLCGEILFNSKELIGTPSNNINGDPPLIEVFPRILNDAPRPGFPSLTPIFKLAT
ncbi:Uncharacterised protein [Sphingobacterium daejeonense]|nr:Uncharacterised protein [Sphingobacterium daejeonense]